MVANIIYSIRLNATLVKCHLVAINPSGILQDCHIFGKKSVASSSVHFSPVTASAVGLCTRSKMLKEKTFSKSRAPVKLSGHQLADFWTQGAQYYKHLYACSRSMEGLSEAIKVLWNLSEQGLYATRKEFFKKGAL